MMPERGPARATDREHEPPDQVRAISGPGGLLTLSGNPATFLESNLKLFRDFVGSRLGAPLQAAPPACLVIEFDATHNDETSRVSGSGHRGWRKEAGRLSTLRLNRSRPETLQTLRRHPETFDHGLHLGFAGTEAKEEPLSTLAAFGRDEITLERSLTHGGLLSSRRERCGHSHRTDILHQSLCDDRTVLVGGV